jgi:4-hydroxy-tetrahydrodipicolinate reductase
LKAPIRIAVAGLRGRMGRALAELLAREPDGIVFVGGFGRDGAAGDGLIDRRTAIETADVVLDFTTGSAAAELAELCAARGGPALVIGATGFEPDEIARIDAAARRIPIVRSGNFSIGVNMLMDLVTRAARLLPPQTWDIEVVEMHHRHKIDAPSGTALMLGEAAAAGRSVDLSSVERRGRDGISGERPVGEIGFAALRGGGVIGEHDVIFAAADEVVTLSHSATDRGMFARGALAAARWVVGRAPGVYDMQDVLGSEPHHGSVVDLPAPIRAYVDAYNRRDVAGMLACLADDVVFRNLSDGAVTAETADKSAFAELAAFGAAAFSQRRQTVVRAITVADRTLVEITYAATVARDLPNGWKAGQTLDFAGASSFRLENGLIAEIVDQS